MSLTPEAWNLLKYNLKEISLFFDGQTNQRKLSCGNFNLYFTNSFGERIVILEQTEDLSKEKLFHPYILNKANFYVLQKISFCIE